MRDRGAVAITGAGGFVGERIAEGLAECGWSVVKVTSRPNVARSTAYRTVLCDWAPAAIRTMVAAVGTVDAWVHAAARIDFDDRVDVGLYRSNTLLTDILASEVARSGCRFVHLSTVSVYPVREPDFSGSPVPDTHYGMSKLLAENAVSAHLGSRGLSLRLAGVWGAEPAPKMLVNRCLAEAMAGRDVEISSRGDALRNYLWVGDLPSVIDRCIIDKIYGTAFASGSESLSLWEMVSLIARVCGVTARRGTGPSGSDMIVPTDSRFVCTPFEQALRAEVGRAEGGSE